MNEAEIATKRTIMVNIDGVLFPREIAIKRHNKNTPKKIKPKDNTMSEKMTNEDSESRAMRSNEYAFHSSPQPAPKKVRLKNKATGATVGIFPNHREATIAHNKHPLKHKLVIEGIYMDKHELVRGLMENRKEFQINEDVTTLKFSEYRVVFEEQVDLIESKIEEKKQLLLDKKGTVNGIEVDSVKESVFDWKKPVDKRPDWSRTNDDQKPAKVAKPAVDPDAPKRGRGRPAGKYGSYKVKDRSAADKKAIADKVHSNPERKANYDASIAARKEFKQLMDAAIKAKQAQAK